MKCFAALRDDQSLLSMFTFLGFCFFVAWGCQCIFGFPLIFNSLVPDSADYMFFEAFFFFAFAIALAICGLMADHHGMFPDNRLLLACGGITVLLSLTLLLDSQTAVLAYLVSGCLLSAITAFCFLCWLNILAKNVTPSTAILYAIAAAAATLIAYFIFMLIHPLSTLIAMILFLASLLIMAIVNSVIQKDENVQRRESEERRPLYWKTHLNFDVYGLVFGMTFYSLANLNILPMVILALIVGAFAAVIDIWHAGGVYTERLRREITLIMMLGLIVTPFLSNQAYAFVWCAFTGLFSYFLRPKNF